MLAGIDVLRAEGFKALAGKRVALLTNHTGRDRDGTATIDLLAQASNVKLVSLFSPEHGIRGLLDASVPSTTDEKTRLPIHSLYGATRRPTAEMLTGVEAIVVDLQDIGTRFYTYMTSMAYVLEEAAARKIAVVVLDRPNPIGGVQIEGPSLDESAVGFTGYLPAMPIRHGMTMGELARLFNAEKKINADLTVVAMKNWRRDAWFDETGLTWIGPSPNMRNLHQATLYPGIGAFESTNISVGRGTDTPFEHVGAPWIDGVRLAEALNVRQIPGVRFYPVRFTPVSSKFANEECGGVFMVITDRASLRPVRVGVELASALLKLFPGKLEIDAAARLFGSTAGAGETESGRGSGGDSGDVGQPPKEGGGCCEANICCIEIGVGSWPPSYRQELLRSVFCRELFFATPSRPWPIVVVKPSVMCRLTSVRFAPDRDPGRRAKSSRISATSWTGLCHWPEVSRSGNHARPRSGRRM